VNFLENFSSF